MNAPSTRITPADPKVEDVPDTLPDGAIAVIGMAGRFPGAPSIDDFAQLLWEGREGITRFDPDEADTLPLGSPIARNPDYVPAAAPLDGIDLFDAEAFGLSARETLFLDPQHRLFLECAVEALDDAAIDPVRFAAQGGARIGVFGGCSLSSYLLHTLIPARLVFEADPLELIIGCDKDTLATRVAYLLDLEGPAVTVQSACSTSLLAVHMAVQSLLSGECDAALAGGVAINTPQRLGYVFHPAGIRSPDGRCRPFDKDAAGTVFGNGVGLVVLRPLRDALAAGDPIRAVIRATAANNDGNAKVGFTAPSVEGQTQVLSEALSLSGLTAAEIGYIEAHGTATPMGDPIEFAAIKEVYGGAGEDAPGCLLGSVKSNVGHLDSAAGIAGLIKTILCVERGAVPPTLNYRAPNPELALEATRFRVAAANEPWPQPGQRRAAVSSFGVGGTNVHAVVEQAPDSGNASEDGAPEDGAAAVGVPSLLPLSAMSEAGLAATAARLGGVADRIRPADLAWTLQTGRAARSVRAAVVATPDRLGKTLGAIRQGRIATVRPRAAFLLAGQGSQSPGMARALAERHPAFRDALEACIAGFRQAADLDLAPLLLDTDRGDQAAAEALRQTAIAQPAIFSHTLACAGLWQALGLLPEALLGHSIGEWSAAVLAEIVTLEDAIALVARRGALMQAAPDGAMLAVPRPEAACRRWIETGEIDLAAVNGAALCILSGPRAALERVQAEEPDAKWLRTSHGFHSRAMDVAAANFTEAVAGITLKPPRIPILSNVTGAVLTDKDAVRPRYWGSQLRQTVQFHRALSALSGMADVLIECGPGDGLTGPASLAFAEAERHDAVIAATSPSVNKDATSGPAVFLAAVGAAWEAGADIDWDVLHGPGTRRRVRLPATAFNRRRHWPVASGEALTLGPAAPLAAPLAIVPEAAGEAEALTPLERLCALWAQTLALPEVAPDERFLDFGGTSIIAMQLVARCAAHGFRFKAADVLKAQTPRALLAIAALPDPAPDVRPDMRPNTRSDRVAKAEAPNAVTLTAAQTLAAIEGEDQVLRLQAHVRVSPEQAMASGRSVAQAAVGLRVKITSSWHGITASRVPYHDGLISRLDAEQPGPALVLDQGISGALSVWEGADGNSRIEVALHPAAGDALEAVRLLETWVRRCQDPARTNPPADPLGDRHAPIADRPPPRPPTHTAMVPVTETDNGTLALPTAALADWAAHHQVDDGVVLAAAGIAAGADPAATRVALRSRSRTARAFSLPPLPASYGLDDVILALKLATAPTGAALPIAPPDGTRVLWLGDLSTVAADDAAGIVQACANALRATRSQDHPRVGLALARHADELLAASVSSNPMRTAGAVLTDLFAALQALPDKAPSRAHRLTPSRFTAADIPFADLSALFGLETASHA